MQYLSDVFDFHNKFNIPQPDTCEQGLDEETMNFRIKFMFEELEEFIEAVNEEDLEKQLDSLVDLVYVVLGAALMLGFDFDEAWRRVHAANMEKVAGLPTDRHGSLDVTKPEGWQPPVLSDLVDPNHRRIVPDIPGRS